MSHLRVLRSIEDLKEMKRIKNQLSRYVFYPNLFVLSIIHYLKKNFKEVSVHLSSNYLESRGKDSREIYSCLQEEFSTTVFGKSTGDRDHHFLTFGL